MIKLRVLKENKAIKEINRNKAIHDFITAVNPDNVKFAYNKENDNFSDSLELLVHLEERIEMLEKIEDEDLQELKNKLVEIGVEFTQTETENYIILEVK
jgi:hypothetical protein